MGLLVWRFLQQNLFGSRVLMSHLRTLERRAKETLQFLSNNDHTNHWNTLENEYQPQSMELKRKKHRETAAFQSRKRNRISTAIFSGKNIKNIIAPKVITFEQCPISMREMNAKPTHRRDIKRKLSVHNHRTLNCDSISLQQGVQGIDFMKYWVRHRFEEKSINSLVSRIEQKRQQLRDLRS